jgi:tRNA threonylcarbamoyladenosine biosynthesis protein TsaE
MIHLPTPQDTEDFGARLANHVEAGDVIALYGDLGAGKTSLARGLLRALGLVEDAPSPTFPIVVTYDHLRLPIWHVDLYRLDDPEDVDELGLDDILSDGALIIEWPERMGARLWPSTLKIHISHHPNGGRGLTVEAPEAWKHKCHFQ